MAKRSKKQQAPARRISVDVVAPEALAGQKPFGFGRDWLWGLVLVLAVILAYLPVRWAGFVWDDTSHITENPCIIGPLGLKEIWTTHAASVCPLTLTTFWVEHALWGLNPLPYHLVNVVLHAACAILFWQVLRILRIPGAWLGAALWALHPLQVESVAWITEMKNTQSCLFYLLTILFFVKWLKACKAEGRPGAGWSYALTLLFAGLAIASKFSTVILPAVLFLCAWWIEGRWSWKHLARLAPVFAMSAIAIVVTLWLGTTEQVDAVVQLPRSWPERFAASGDVFWFYLGKLVWPHPLMAIYPRWEINPGQMGSYLPVLAAIILLVVFWFKRGTWARPYFFAVAYFLAVLLPFLGFVDQSFWRYSFVEDHLQYLAGMGPLALAGAGMVWLGDVVLREKRWLQLVLEAALLSILGILTWQRAGAFESEETLWTDNVAKNPQCWAGYNNLGSVLLQRGQVDDAIPEIQKALEINPDYADAHYNLALALLQKRQVDDAVTQLRRALEISPNYVEALNTLGWAFSQNGQTDDAIVEFRKALAVNPAYAKASDNLGATLLQKGRVDEAIAEFQRLIVYNPNLATAHYNLGVALLDKGEIDAAISEFQAALQLKPDFSDAQSNLAKAQAMGAQNSMRK